MLSIASVLHQKKANFATILVTMRKPSKLFLQSLSRPCSVLTSALVSVLLVASCSGLGVFVKRIVLQMLRRQMLRVIWGKDMQLRNVHEEASAMAVANAVKAASSAAAQVACLSQLMLTIRAEEKHQTKIVVSALQAVTSKITQVLLTMRDLHALSPAAVLSTVAKSNSAHDKESTKQFPGNAKVDKDKGSAKMVPFVVFTGKPLGTSQSDVQKSTRQPASFMEVMAMLERGETPPGIKEINDKPPIPNQLPSKSCLQPKPKPWEMEDEASILNFRG